MRIRLVGGRTTRTALRRLSELAAEYGDGNIHLTSRANLQIRGLDHRDGALEPVVIDGIDSAGLLPAPSYDRVRNIMVSPLTGRIGGRADIWPTAVELERALTSDPLFAELSGRFLFVLDDGRGDISSRPADLGFMMIDERDAQLRIGSSGWGPRVELGRTVDAIVGLLRNFLSSRGAGDTAAWHVDELSAEVPPLTSRELRHPATQVEQGRPSYGDHEQDDGRFLWHTEVLDGLLSPEDVESLPGEACVITPWRSVLSPDLEEPNFDVPQR